MTRAPDAVIAAVEARRLAYVAHCDPVAAMRIKQALPHVLGTAAVYDEQTVASAYWEILGMAGGGADPDDADLGAPAAARRLLKQAALAVREAVEARLGISRAARSAARQFPSHADDHYGRSVRREIGKGRGSNGGWD
jgi:hypothetical protein